MVEFSVRSRELVKWSQKVRSEADKVGHYGHRVDQIGRECSLDGSAGITVKKTIRQLAADLEEERRKLGRMSGALEQAARIYEETENRIKEQRKSREYRGFPTGPSIIAKPHIILPLITLISPATGVLYITRGIPFGRIPSFSGKSRSAYAYAGAYAEWLGYERQEGNPGVTAWVGKAGAQAENQWGHAGVNAYLGKADAKAQADFAFMKKTKKTEYQDGKWVEKTKTEFLAAEAGVGASVTVAAADGKAGAGGDMLGAEVKAEGALGTAKAESKGKFSIGSDGVNANVEGKAMVAAAEGKASGTINILGMEITGKVGGYAGAIGAEGKVGFEGGKFVAQGGAAAGVGASAGIEIGFNKTGWNNFVDFVTFWD